MDLTSLYSSFKENGWTSVILLLPFLVNLVGMLTASRFEKQLFKPKQKIYTQSLKLLLHSITATAFAWIFFSIMGIIITDIRFILVIFIIYVAVFLFTIPLLAAHYRPFHYVEDDIHGRLYLQNVTSEGKLILFSKPSPNKEDGFYVIKDDLKFLSTTKIYSQRKDQSFITKMVISFITKLFKRNQNATP